MTTSCILLVDVEVRTIPRVAARLEGWRFYVTEVIETAFDEEFPRGLSGWSCLGCRVPADAWQRSSKTPRPAAALFWAALTSSAPPNTENVLLCRSSILPIPRVSRARPRERSRRRAFFDVLVSGKISSPD